MYIDLFRNRFKTPDYFSKEQHNDEKIEREHPKSRPRNLRNRLPSPVKVEETPFEALASICSVLVVGLFILTFIAQELRHPFRINGKIRCLSAITSSLTKSR